jgi:hypothetical protein
MFLRGGDIAVKTTAKQSQKITRVHIANLAHALNFLLLMLCFQTSPPVRNSRIAWQ